MADPETDILSNANVPGGFNQVVAFLKRHGFKDAEEVLIREASQSGVLRDETDMNVDSAEDKINASDATALSSEYESLIKYIDGAFDGYKCELANLLYPIYANGYLDLILSEQTDAALAFQQRFSSVVPSWYADDVHTLSRIITPVQAAANELVENLRNHTFLLKMSKSCVKQLEPFLSKNPVIKAIIKERMAIEAVDVAIRQKDTVEAMSGGVLGEASKQTNKQKVFYGTIKEDFTNSLPNILATEDISSRSKKRSRLKESGGREAVGKKKDPNAPALARVPLPDWSNSVRVDKRQAQKDLMKKVKICPENPPSVCFFTLLNAHASACCAEITEDTTMLAAGFGNSTVQVFPLNSQKLRPVKPIEQLELLDPESENMAEEMLDDSKGSSSKTLTGHAGPVYGLSFSLDKRLLLSCSEDSTVRLWSSQLWQNVVVYRVGAYPIWDVKFCARGYYFASAGADRCAMLWATDTMQPIRVFADSFSDVNCVDFHPNCNYVAGGGEDRYVRVWDVLTGSCVRHFTGHKAGVTNVKFSPCGRYIASAGLDNRLIIWDIALQKMAALYGQSDSCQCPAAASSLCFSRDGATLAAGGVDKCLRLFSMDVATTHTTAQEHLTPDPKINPNGFEIFKFGTKQTSILGLHFTRRNLVVGVGAFGQ